MEENKSLPEEQKPEEQKDKKEKKHSALVTKLAAILPLPAKVTRNARLETADWIVSIVSALLVVLVLRMFVFQFVHVDGGSMLETLQDRDILFVTMYDRFRPDGFDYGDVVICNYPGARGYRVKRIMGKPGDTIAVINGVTYRNDEPLEEPYVDPSHAALTNFGPVTVPEDTFFVMGDNRAVSKDSRSSQVGPIAKSEVKGKVRYIVFPFQDIGKVE